MDKPNQKRQKYRDYNKRVRLAALTAVGRGKLVCSNCGCDRSDFLQIHHTEGIGQRERNRSSQAFYRLLARHGRPIDDLDILCRVCHALRDLERIFGQLPYQITWK